MVDRNRLVGDTTPSDTGTSARLSKDNGQPPRDAMHISADTSSLKTRAR